MQESGERIMMMVDKFVVDTRMVMITENDVMVAVMMMMMKVVVVNPCLYAQEVARKLLSYYGIS